MVAGVRSWHSVPAARKQMPMSAAGYLCLLIQYGTPACHTGGSFKVGLPTSGNPT